MPDTIQQVHLIEKALSNKSPLGSWYTLMDAGKLTQLPEGVAGKRLPAWLLPKLTHEVRDRLRPDILVISGLTHRMVAAASPGPHALLLSGTRVSNLKIHVFEVGFCSDKNMTDLDKQKAEQHQQLVALLRDEYGQSKVRLHIYPSAGRAASHTPSSPILLYWASPPTELIN